MPAMSSATFSLPTWLRRLTPGVLFGLAVVLLGLGIWEPTALTGKDEYFLGLRTPMEMMARQEWLVPFLDGAPRVKKPPLLYWLGRASFETLGPSLVSARLIAVLFGALLVAATAGIGQRLTRRFKTGEPTILGAAAALILLSCLGLHSEARRFMLDVPTAALSTAAFWAFLAWLDVPRWPRLTLATLLLAAGFLIKGPVVALVCGGGMVALLASGGLGRATWQTHRGALAGHVLLWLALALPWFLWVKLQYPVAVDSSFADEMESRQFLNLSPGVLLGLVNIALPWAVVFLAGLWQERRAILRQAGPARCLALWFALSFLPFLFIKSFDRYLVGSLVPLALFLAFTLNGLKARWPYRIGLIIALTLGLGLTAFAAWFGRPGWGWLLLPAAYLAWAWWRPHALGHTVAAPALFWIALLWGAVPGLGINAVPDAVVTLGKQRSVAFYDGPQPALLAILSQRPHWHPAQWDAPTVERIARENALVFAEAGDVSALRQAVAAAGYRLEEAGHYTTLASHGSGLRFARVGTAAADWREALRSHDLAPIATTVVWFEVRRP